MRKIAVRDVRMDVFGPRSRWIDFIREDVAMAATVRVWVAPDLQLQHVALPPSDDTTREWDGVTVCGVSGTLRWVHGEVVDAGKTCERCLEAAGPAPALEGDDLGPV